ncbi:NAD(P)-dependent oxidoreductase [Nocardiopsis protaetiae]|uniref:NAD(P)-dependent oxidoreductase n=1 Tax=Nocardiopsis protaetiae TaxID=3382270 RepID=UPI00387B7819
METTEKNTENTTDATDTAPEPVTVIGLGPMGAAMAHAFLDRGHAVTVWNRTAARAEPLVALGATAAPTVADALRASGLAVLSLTDYAAVYALLTPAADALAGRVIVNLSSDTPDRAREASAWLAGHGAHHLTGGVQADPSGIGGPGTSTFYSGPREVFDRHAHTLRALTGTDYRGEDPALAPLHYQLGMDLFWTGLAGWLHSVAVARAHGVSAQEFLPQATATAASLDQMFRFYSPRVDAGEHGGDAERLSMAAASIEHVVDTADRAGVDPSLPAAVLALVRAGVDRGHADESLTSLLHLLRPV